MLHGWGVASQVWQVVLDWIDRGIEVAAPDLPGYDEDAPPSRCDIDGILTDLRARHGSHLILCGWSMGGLLAQYWAASYPNEIDGLVLLSSTPKFMAQDDWPYGMDINDMTQFYDAVAHDVPAALRRFSALQAHGDVHARIVMSALHQALSARRLPSALTLMEGLALLHHTDLRRRSGAIQCPTLIIHGRHDRICPVAAAEWLAGAMADANLSIHEGASHAVFMSDPRRVGNEMSAFVKSIHAHTE